MFKTTVAQREQSALWKTLNREALNARERAYRDRLKDAAYAKLGNRCSSLTCGWVNADGSQGCTDRRCLQIDHVLGDGAEERRRHKTMDRRSFYKQVFMDTQGRYQLLCSNCNWIKMVVNSECPRIPRSPDVTG